MSNWRRRYLMRPMGEWPRRWRLRLILVLLPVWWNFFRTPPSFREKLRNCFVASKSVLQR